MHYESNALYSILAAYSALKLPQVFVQFLVAAEIAVHEIRTDLFRVICPFEDSLDCTLHFDRSLFGWNRKNCIEFGILFSLVLLGDRHAKAAEGEIEDYTGL